MPKPQRPSDTIAGQRREPDSRERKDDPSPRRDERERPIGAAQIAAPSTRRWRRASRFA